jgi:RNA polymerase sigma-70 factor (ECF subfamily)
VTGASFKSSEYFLPADCAFSSLRLAAIIDLLRDMSGGRLSKAAELEQLMSAVAAGDRNAFSMLYRATSAKLYGVVLRILRRRDLADEVIQETYVRIWKNAAAFDPTRASPITWMVTIARNRALDEVRRATPLQIDTTPEALDVADDRMLASEQVELTSDLARLRACLDGLEPDRRAIVRLAYLDGLSREELGVRFGHPPGTIKTWLHRSLKQLKACLTS